MKKTFILIACGAILALGTTVFVGCSKEKIFPIKKATWRNYYFHPNILKEMKKL